MLESQGNSRELREVRVAVTQSIAKMSATGLAVLATTPLPSKAASLSFLRAVVTLARSASVMSKSGRARLSNTPPPPEDCRMSTVPSKCRSRMWFMSTA